MPNNKYVIKYLYS